MSYDPRKISLSSPDQIDIRKKLYSKMSDLKIPFHEKERSLGLFLRGSLLARLLAINEIYSKIIEMPGSICDFGAWRGQTAVVCENLRAIYEPFNYERRIFLFDTFEGYKGFKKNESSIKNFSDGAYSIEKNYEKELIEILLLHEKMNIPNNLINKHKVYKGDIKKTLLKFLNERISYPLSLTFMDFNNETSTFFTLEKIKNNLISGSIIVFWQFQRKEIPGDNKAFFKFVKKNPKITFKVCKSKFYPSMSYVLVK